MTSLTSRHASSEKDQHSMTVRVTHWLTVLAFFALLVTGIGITLSHPRFYWGETGNVNMQPLFSLHLPSTRASVPTGHAVLPDQNGWSRYLHFEAAWLAVLTGLVYGLMSFWNGHFRRDLLPTRAQMTWNAFRVVIVKALHPVTAEDAANPAYNVLQRMAYLGVIFFLFPFIIWTGLAMSPGITSVFPFLAEIFGGRQSARTLHFFASGILVLFVVVHVAMVIHVGFRSRMRAMILGRPEVASKEQV